VHRDLKPANVLYDEQGPVLSDLGVAARIGETDALPPGSPFNASPQQRKGEPPSVSDDVYGFGALCYELLSGYPPYYPDAAAAAGDAPPGPIRSRVAVPPALEQLVQDCLARSVEDRPRDMDAIRDRLARLSVSEREAAPALATRIDLRPPQDAPAPIAPAWRRATPVAGQGSGHRAQQVRRGVIGASLGALALAVALAFIVLPRWVEQRRPAAVTPKPAAPAAPAAPTADDKKRDLQRLAEVKREFETLLPDIRTRFEKLEARGAADWGGESFARVRTTFESANRLFGQADYDRALADLKRVVPDLTTTEKAAAGVLQAALTAGNTALVSGTAAEAEQAFSRALKLEPNHAQAKRGLERARTLDEVRRLLADAERFESEGRTTDAAVAYRKALALDRDATAAHQALARLASAESNAAFAAAMSQGLAALNGRDYAKAKGAFQRALAIRPGAPEAQDGLAQVAREQGDAGIAEHLAAAERAEAEERWQAALESYRRALAIDGNLLVAQQGVERAEPRAALEAQLNGFASRPERLFSAEVRAAARNSLQRARAITPAGPVLTRQIETVASLIAAAEVPVAVALTSDNQTIVTIYRVGRIGAFERKDMELLPGRYTIVGSRSGFRDVRRELMVMPGQTPPPVAIQCEEPI
jgi:tetratricopeptide (TPR) repeat protein